MTYVKYYPIPRTREANVYAEKAWNPAYDAVEYKDRFVLEFDLPGFAKSDFTINVKEGILTVSGERKARNEEEGDFYRYYGDLMFALSKPVDIIDLSVSSKFSSLIKQEGVFLYG